MRLTLTAISFTLLACGGKDNAPAGGNTGGAGGAGDNTAKAPATLDPAVIAGVEAKLPESLKGKVTFEAVEGEKGRHLAVQPKGWETGVIPGRVKPPAGGPDLGFMTAFSTGSNCDGSCEAKDWAAVSDKVEFSQFTGGDWQIEKDEKLADGRLLVAKKADRVDIALARWKTGASRYFSCRATLDKPLMEAAAAFEEACRQLKIVE